MLSYYQYAPVHNLFEMQVEQSPDSVAVVFEKQENEFSEDRKSVV